MQDSNPYLSEEKAQGFLYDLDWIEKNHAKVDIFIQHVFTEQDADGFWDFVYRYPQQARMIVQDYFTSNFDKWRIFFYNLLTGERGETIIVVGDKGMGKDVVTQWIVEVHELARKMQTIEGDMTEFQIEEMDYQFKKERGIRRSWYHPLTIKLAKWITNSNLPLFHHVCWAGFYFDYLPRYFKVIKNISSAPEKSLTCLNEGAIFYSSKRGMRNFALEATYHLATSRHRDQTLMIVTQSTALLQLDFLRMCDCIIKKPMTEVHENLERKTLGIIASLMKPKDYRQTYISYRGYNTLCTNPLPRYWGERFSKSMTFIKTEDEARKEAVKLFQRGLSSTDISIMLGSRGFDRPAKWYDIDPKIQAELADSSEKK